MHVVADTSLAPSQVLAKLGGLRSPSGESPDHLAGLRLEADRQPPKLFLAGSPITFPTAAELAVAEQAAGAEVVLRLMWGPLPAPFPRALAGAGLLLGGGVVALAPVSGLAWVVGLLLAGAPALALAYQAQGERRLQATLSQVLGAPFRSKPH